MKTQKRYVCGCIANQWRSADNCTNLKGHGLFAEDFKSQHTPTPWTFIMAGEDKTQVLIDSEEKLVLHGSSCASMSKKEAKANAAFIVKAVNSHEALLNGAQKALEELSNWVEGQNGYEPENAIVYLKKAIAQAEGK